MQYKIKPREAGGSVRSALMPPLPHLRAWRLHRGLTQDQLAVRLHVALVKAQQRKEVQPQPEYAF